MYTGVTCLDTQPCTPLYTAVYTAVYTPMIEHVHSRIQDTGSGSAHACAYIPVYIAMYTGVQPRIHRCLDRCTYRCTTAQTGLETHEEVRLFRLCTGDLGSWVVDPGSRIQLRLAVYIRVYIRVYTGVHRLTYLRIHQLRIHRCTPLYTAVYIGWCKAVYSRVSTWIHGCTRLGMVT